MLKWAVTPRFNGDFFEQDGLRNGDSYELQTLQSIIEQNRLPCLVRLVNDDMSDSIDNYCLLLCETTEPYLIVSNETDRFSVPMSFDGLFAQVERGVTRYNILQSVRSLQSYLKSHSSPTNSSVSHFTTLQPCMAYSNSALRRIRSGTVLEPYRSPSITSPSPPPTTLASNRLRQLLANLPHSLNKHLLPHHQQSRLIKQQTPPHDYLEVRSISHDEHFCLKSDSIGMFAPVHTQLPASNSHRRSSLIPYSSSSSLNHTQGLYTVDVLSKLTHQFPLITELVVSRTFEEGVPTPVGYPFRRSTLHRVVEDHTRLIAFDMKNYAFVELDTTNAIDLYAFEPEDTLFQRYQAQLRWCQENLASFQSQIKTIVHTSRGTAMFVQAIPLQGQQQHHRRNSSSVVTSPLAKHIPLTIFTSQESISSGRSRAITPMSSKFHTSSSRHNSQELNKGKSMGSGTTTRKDVRVYFNDPTIQQRMKIKSPAPLITTRSTIKRTTFGQHLSTYRANSAGSDSIDGDDDIDDNYECTPL